MFVVKSLVVDFGDAFELHTSDTFANPLIKSEQLGLDVREGSREVVGKARDSPVEIEDDILVEIMRSDGLIPNIVLNFLQRLLSNGNMFVVEVEAKEVETEMERSNRGLFGGELKVKLILKNRGNKSHSLFSVLLVMAEDNEVVRKADKVEVFLRQT